MSVGTSFAKRGKTARDLLGPKRDESYVPVRRESVGPIAPESFAGRVTETFGPEETESFRVRAANAPIHGLNPNQALQECASVLREAYGDERHGAKKLAEDAGANPRAAKNWLGGQCMPDFFHGMKIAAHCPEFADWVRRLTAMHAELNAEFMRDYLQMQRSFAKMAGPRR